MYVQIWSGKKNQKFFTLAETKIDNGEQLPTHAAPRDDDDKRISRYYLRNRGRKCGRVGLCSR